MGIKVPMSYLENEFTGCTSKGILPSVNFIVFFNEFAMGFQSVSEITMGKEYRYVNEGGSNGYPARLRVPNSSPHKLVFKRGYRLKKWASLDSLALLGVGAASPEQAIKNPGLGLILVLDSDRNIKTCFAFISQGQTDWSLSDLDAQNSAPLIETFTITHTGLKEIPTM